ncbi:MAG TPA: PAS domain-containing sensor histidine kinase [Polyangiaceae bacterium]|nr:PAS domain-containing sensor histidine kinase [Polyangiaceae bacterium]
MVIATLEARQYRTIVEHAPMMVWRSGRDAKFDYVNSTWLKFTGRRFEQEMGEGWLEAMHPDDRQRCVSLYLDRFEKRLPWEKEFRLLRHDGVYRYVLEQGVPYADDRGEFSGCIGSVVDVHERKELDRAKTRFLATMAHELRTPLTPLRTYVQTLGRAAAEDAPLSRALVERLNAQLGKLTALVQELGDNAQLEEGRPLNLTMERVDLASLIQRVVDTHRASVELKLAPDRGHAITVAASCPCYVRGDSSRLEQVVTSLLDNALKFSPSGGGIRIGLAAVERECRLTIADEGIGVPAEELSALTRRYFRASNATEESFPGIGLGLSLSRDILERHGGVLSFESKLGRGTVAKISLPEQPGA